MTEPIDHQQLAISRLATQFKDSTNLINYILALLFDANNIEEAIQEILTERFIDTAFGVQLDILGELVGQPREIVGAEILGFFGYAVNPESGPYGSLATLPEGNRFRGLSESTTGNRVLSDPEYRLFIRARIIRNITTCTPEEIIAQIIFLLPQVQPIILTEGTAYYTISLGGIISDEELSLLVNTDTIQKPAGVGLKYITNFDPDDFFSFSNVPGSKGYGELGNLGIGGTYQSLIT